MQLKLIKSLKISFNTYICMHIKKNKQKNDFQNHITTTLYITEVTLNGLDHLGFIIILYHMGNGLRKMKYSYVHTNVDIVWTFRKSKPNKPHISPSTSIPW